MVLFKFLIWPDLTLVSHIYQKICQYHLGLVEYRLVLFVCFCFCFCFLRFGYCLSMSLWFSGFLGVFCDIFFFISTFDILYLLVNLVKGLSLLVISLRGLLLHFFDSIYVLYFLVGFCFIGFSLKFDFFLPSTISGVLFYLFPLFSFSFLSFFLM